MEPMEENCQFHAGVEYVENLSDSGARLFSNDRVYALCWAFWPRWPT